MVVELVGIHTALVVIFLSSVVPHITEQSAQHVVSVMFLFIMMGPVEKARTACCLQHNIGVVFWGGKTFLPKKCKIFLRAKGVGIH